ncbi:MAG: hypothetical protein IJ300_01550 [Clostridia bacterium]|nr:hypothetical protein [Clostridia bacterium]MBQ8765973.1 hypothetical protein [Clostridia bacterium]
MPILHIRDETGNFVPIYSIKGADGKSAYEQAKEGGYSGTEEEFIALLNGLTSSEDAEHYSDFNNPHQVTKEQIGLGNVDNLSVKSHLDNSSIHVTKNDLGGIKIGSATIDDTCCVAIGETADAMISGVAIGDSASASEGVAIGFGTSSPYVGVALGYRTFSSERSISIGMNSGADILGIAIGNGALAENSGAIQIGGGSNYNANTLQVYDYQLLDANGKIPSDRLPIATGTYTGTDTYGVSNPNTLTFDFVPKFVIVTKRGNTNATSGGAFIWINPGSTLNFHNDGSNYWCHPSLDGTTLSWYNTEGAVYQLNSSSYEYYYFAAG